MRMKVMLIVLAGLSVIGALQAGEIGNEYVNGVEGLKAASIPPPGLYARIYGVNYRTDEMKDADGNDLDIGFDVSIWALVPRVIWVSEYKILGGNYVADVIVPLIYTDLEIEALQVDDSSTGLGDVCIEPFVLSWHGERYDTAAGLGLYLPVGKYDKNEPSSPGKDMWTGMLTLGSTYYFDAAKTWHISALGRYEIHSEKGDVNSTPGHDFHVEWGLGKTVAKTWDVGLSGYGQWQVTDDSGDDVTGDKDKDSTLAVGPEVSTLVPAGKFFLSLRTLWEFEVKDRSQGMITCLTLTKRF